MKTLYLDLFSGISGDMFIGAMIDLGVNPERLEAELRKLPVGHYHLHTGRGEKCGITGTKFDVHLESDHDHDHEHEHDHHHHHGEHEHSHTHEHGHEHSHSHDDDHSHAHGHSHTHAPDEPEHHHHDDQRSHGEIQDLIARSSLSDWVKGKASAVFQRIAVAEGKIHGVPVGEVHFHEVGAVDSIVDIVGAAICLEMLGQPRVVASPLFEGQGWVNCAHGRFPIPAPATLEILGARGIPLSQCDEPHEMITPTGAALVAEFATAFGPMRDLVAERIGFGVGTRDHQTRPNVLRAVLGHVSEASHPGALDWETDTVAVLESNLDDVSPQVLGQFLDLALAAGALDVFHTPIQMKKNRPGTLLTVLCAEADTDKFAEMVLRHTTAFGVRRHVAERRKLKRDFRTVQTPYGPVTVKIGTLNGAEVQIAPEYESVRQAADRAGVPFRIVYASALQQD